MGPLRFELRSLAFSVHFYILINETNKLKQETNTHLKKHTPEASMMTRLHYGPVRDWLERLNLMLVVKLDNRLSKVEMLLLNLT